MAQTVSLIRLGGGDIVLPFEGAVFRRSQIRDELPDLQGGFAVLGFLDDSSRPRQVGVLARVSVSSSVDASTGYVHLRGLRRVSVGGATVGPLVRLVPHQAELGDASNVKRMVDTLRSTLSKSMMGKTLRVVDAGKHPGVFADILASLLVPTRDAEIKTELLEGSVERRLEIVTALLDSYIVKGDTDGGTVEAGSLVANEGDRFERMLNERGANKETVEAVKREIEKLGSMNEMHPSHAGQKAWIEIVCSIPWNVLSHHRALTIGEARRVLDSNHFGLANVKRRVVEYVAVLRMTATTSKGSAPTPGPILLLVGPPGTGKTSLAKSIADCVDKKFERISLGGVRDEAEIRGHRRTYIGSFPGKVVNALRRSGVSDPLILIDEVDKVASNNFGRGDVSSALLELLDPEQNMAFKDHFVDLPLDLSRVTFVCTANSLETVPAPLIDRCEVVELASYTVAEKRVIAQRHLLPAVLRHCGLSSGSLKLTNEAVDAIIAEYTKEAGVRGLRKVLEAIARDIVVSHVERGTESDVPVSEVGLEQVRAIMGPPKFSRPDASTHAVGCATGLVWTPVGGLTQLVECLWVPNDDGSDVQPLSHRLVLTGSAGEVLRESAIIAMSWLRANRDRLGVRDTSNINYHIHLPAGAVPKDGPSAGITILVALFSLQTGRTVRPMIAFTGELSLLGQVLPVGGIKEKLIAAHTAGMQTVVVPKANLSTAKRCLEDEHLDGDLQVLPVSSADQVLEAAFGALAFGSQAQLVSRM